MLTKEENLVFQQTVVIKCKMRPSEFVSFKVGLGLG